MWPRPCLRLSKYAAIFEQCFRILPNPPSAELADGGPSGREGVSEPDHRVPVPRPRPPGHEQPISNQNHVSARATLLHLCAGKAPLRSVHHDPQHEGERHSGQRQRRGLPEHHSADRAGHSGHRLGSLLLAEGGVLQVSAQFHFLAQKLQN